MAELLAIGQDLKNLIVVDKLNEDGSADIMLTGNTKYKPELRLTEREVASLVKAWTAAPMPAPAPKSEPEPPPTPVSGPIIGCNVYGATEAESHALIAAGVTSARLEAGRDTINTWRALGFKNNVIVVGNTDDSQPLSSVNIESWVEMTVVQIETCIKEGVVLCEVGNEMYLKDWEHEEPVKYAEMFVALHAALVAKGVRSSVKLLFNAFGGGWIHKAVTAQSDLKTMIDGFTHHPYGRPQENKDGNEWGPGAVIPLHTEAVSLGVLNANFYITEFGIEAPGGKGSEAIVAKTATEQDAWAKQVYTELLATGFVAGIWWFAVKDGEGKWGLFEGATATSRGVLSVIASFV